TDISGNTVWSAKYTSFGEAIVDSTSTIVNNLRFPGQYFDEETGKHYNLNRYYDPNSGRFISNDPIGFKGGDVNLYRYVGNNVVNWVDPMGLFVIDIYERGTKKGDAYGALIIVTAESGAW
ncbi:MAG: RHS repeat-associated core domain-containing protein, partial [Nitrospiraceae bacterium]|nr:RHS repeat-associated core domain-containing protein [Nitrospiraceae bacterium]